MKIMPKTKIIGTIGPASSQEKTLEALIRNGLDVVRLNFSFGTHEGFGEIIKRVREIEKAFKRPIAIIQDLQGIKIRTGPLKKEEVTLKKGEDFTITTAHILGDDKIVSTSYSRLPMDLKSGDKIFIDDGLIQLEVKNVKDSKVYCHILEGGILRPYKGMNLPGVSISVPSLTRKDIDDLRFGISHGIDYVALSFVRSDEDIIDLREVMRTEGVNIPVIAKIERPEAIKNLDGILKMADAIMIARGDLGVEMSPEDVPILQKEIILKARRSMIPVITATQMLESMKEYLRPTRAEASDVANAILDGTDAVLLSAETSIGKYPVETVRMMARIIDAAEKSEIKILDSPPREKPSIPEAISNSACHTAKEIGAKAIVAFTQSGFTALLISKFRPTVPIIAFSPHKGVMRKMSLYWGVIPKRMRPIKNTDEMIDELDRIFLTERLARKGDTLVILSGAPIHKRGATNLMKIHKIGVDPHL